MNFGLIILAIFAGYSALVFFILRFFAQGRRWSEEGERLWMRDLDEKYRFSVWGRK